MKFISYLSIRQDLTAQSRTAAIAPPKSACTAILLPAAHAFFFVDELIRVVNLHSKYLLAPQSLWNKVTGHPFSLCNELDRSLQQPFTLQMYGMRRLNGVNQIRARCSRSYEPLTYAPDLQNERNTVLFRRPRQKSCFQACSKNFRVNRNSVR